MCTLNFELLLFDTFSNAGHQLVSLRLCLAWLYEVWSSMKVFSWLPLPFKCDKYKLGFIRVNVLLPRFLYLSWSIFTVFYVSHFSPQFLLFYYDVYHCSYFHKVNQFLPFFSWRESLDLFSKVHAAADETIVVNRPDIILIYKEHKI